uniref:BTB domain-containing protein n=1 Tax=Biomphalaria glabrata TaxID=6526 RepID=A0A2C9JE41_BIOGL
MNLSKSSNEEGERSIESSRSRSVTPDTVIIKTITGDNLEVTLQDEENFITSLKKSFNERHSSDVKIKVCTKTFYAHKFILAKVSPVFNIMLCSKNWQESLQEEVTLIETEECLEHFETFLQFFYSAKINICVKSAIPILSLAEKYDVGSLKSLCTQYMVKHSRYLLVESAIKWYNLAHFLNIKEITMECFANITRNTHKLLMSSEWLQLDLGLITSLLKSGDLVIESEYSLFQAILNWLHTEGRKDLYFHIEELLPLIRFSQLQKNELLLVEENSLYQDEKVKPLLDKQIQKAYRFRTLCSVPTERVLFTDEFYLPRIYLNNILGTITMCLDVSRQVVPDIVRTYVTPVPTDTLDAEWKLACYNSDTWCISLTPYQSALRQGETKVQAVVLIRTQENHIIQVESSDVTICTKRDNLVMRFEISNLELSRNMAVIAKTLPK